MDFQVLGPLRVTVGGSEIVTATAFKPRLILAVLLCRVGHVVPVDTLADALWGERPPPPARRNIQQYVHRLRRALGADLIRGGSGGYAVVPAGDIDAQVFARTAAEGHVLLRSGDAERAYRPLRAALDLWRGPAYGEFVECELVAQEAQRLERLRLDTAEWWARAQLATRQYGVVLPELEALVRVHPYREKLHEYLMIALYQLGRRAEALETFRRVREQLVDELGMVPGPELRAVHEAILRDEDVALDEPAPTSVPAMRPRELPVAAAGFVGRDGMLKTLDSVLPGSGAIVAVTGTAGVGKTALAVRWGHRNTDRFPDGQLYVNLRGYAPGQPVRPIEALGVLLRSLGLPPERVPVDLDEAATLYRSLLAGRRALVMLDNARSAEQVRPLLPGAPGCAVLLTSRDRLVGLVAREGARGLTLDVLDPGEAYQLLEQVLGADRVGAEPAAAAELAAVCAYLPLALRIAAATLLSRPHRSIAVHVAAVRAGHGLAELAIDGDEEAAVRVAFDLSYRTVPADAQRLFRLLGLLPGPDVTAEAAGALAGIQPDVADRLLDQLAGAHLLDEHAPNRFTFHDLLRRFARERCEQHDPAGVRAAALRMLFDWYQRCVDTAATVLYQQVVRLPEASTTPAESSLAEPGPALAWLDAEWHNLAAAIQHTAEQGPHPVAWRLADGLRGYFARRRHLVDWLATGEAALSAAQAEGHTHGQAAMHHTLAQAHYCLAQFPRATQHLTAALPLAEGTWPAGYGSIIGNLGSIYGQSGRLDEAIQAITRALEQHRLAGNPLGETVCLNNLANTHRQTGRLAEALAILAKADLDGADPVALETLSQTLLELGRYRDAAEKGRQALAASRRAGHRLSEAASLLALAQVLLETGEPHHALEHTCLATTLLQEIGDRALEAEAFTVLGKIHARLGDHNQALHSHERALATALATTMPFPQAIALIGMADAYRGLRRHEESIRHAERALDLARRRGFGLLAGQALTALSAAHLAAGNREAAARFARSALASHRQTGHRQGEAHTLAILASIPDLVA